MSSHFINYLLWFFLGILNLGALKNIITDQQMKYDFTYYEQDYETQIPVLTLSIGKSLLPVIYLVNISFKMSS